MAGFKPAAERFRNRFRKVEGGGVDKAGRIELGLYGVVTEIDTPAYPPIESGPQLNPPTGQIELPSSGWNEV